ncbi:hypothetical protein H257_15142 [Aphanomyces astaci]|uniref:Uncharacterized protein n=1 Tax=Aphanomyces astaci TaxID=112090 RepID=W4FNC0_APHAT|nr:hypothetical protein H257_15142 [Aphanomyces astaci]ETV68987.1 hypothetical protein H257_15142 [Aphanomyces astaci]|eukprot:XP_009841446.1 hypothetical protein H257_15142 [Aphanomyces astaci]
MPVVVLPPLSAHQPQYSTMETSTTDYAYTPSPRRCAVLGCLHYAKLHAVCLVHHRQPPPQSGSSPTNAPKRRNKKCQSHRCESFARSGGFCTRHGGGRKCKVAGCTTASQTGGHCRLHGGGSKCKIDKCDQFARTRGMCLPHSRAE